MQAEKFVESAKLFADRLLKWKKLNSPGFFLKTLSVRLPFRTEHCPAQKYPFVRLYPCLPAARETCIEEFPESSLPLLSLWLQSEERKLLPLIQGFVSSALQVRNPATSR